MATNKNTIQVYRDWKKTFDYLSDEEAGQLIKHFFSYVNDDNPKQPTGIVGMAWIPIESQLKRDLKKWENICERNAINGAKGGRPKNPVGYLGKSENPKKPQKADKDKDKDKDKDIYKYINIEERKLQFGKLLQPFKDKYSVSILKDFYEYWTEHGLRDKKMRFEKEKSFGVARRLSTWSKNQSKFDPKSKENKREQYDNYKPPMY